LSDAYHEATGNAAGIIVIISLMAILNGVIVNIVMGSRFLYGLASKGWITGWFAKVTRTHVPARGLTVVAVTALICAILFPIEHLAQATSLLLLFVFCAVNVSLIVIRRNSTASKERVPRISPSFIPWLGALTSGALLVWQAATIVGSLRY
jgi:basic amino acid/polyamine antiporter, APA family